MIATSLDGQWATVRRGREVTVLAGGGAPVGRIELEAEAVDLAFVGPPTVLAAITRQQATTLTLHLPPTFEPAIRLELPTAMTLAAVSGPRLALASSAGKVVQIVRTLGRALQAQPAELAGPLEFAVGLERNQFLFEVLGKHEVWDAVSVRSLSRLAIELPPSPRTVGAARGHLWATRSGSDEVFVYRLSDCRPFRHHVGAPVTSVVCHPASPSIVLATSNGLVRLNCFAHALSLIECPWVPGMALALQVAGDAITLLGLGADDATPWRVSITQPPA